MVSAVTTVVKVTAPYGVKVPVPWLLMTQTPALQTGGAVWLTVSLALTWTVCEVAVAAAAWHAAKTMPAGRIAATRARVVFDSFVMSLRVNAVRVRGWRPWR